MILEEPQLWEITENWKDYTPDSALAWAVEKGCVEK